MKMRFLPDEPVANSLEDALGFSDFVDLIQTSIYSTQAPFVYGVLGDWGTGKTSILQLLANKLTKDFDTGANACVPIWFNAWQYENEANIIYPLLHTINKNYEKRKLVNDGNFGNRFRQVVGASALALTDISLRVATKFFTGEALKLEDVQKQLTAVKEHPEGLAAILNSWADEVGNLHSAFEQMLDAYASDLKKAHPNFAQNDIRFIILIDDLDRCLPETAIAILESIKNYLTVAHCIFVLGLNPGVIYQGIKTKYQGLEINGREYLEKILNYSFYVPEPEVNRIAKFAKDQITQLVTEPAAQEKHVQYFEQFGQGLELCRLLNPRKIKRILNRYLFFLSKYEPSLDSYHNPNVVRLIVLAEYFPDLFQILLKDDAARDAIADLKQVGSPTFDIQNFETKFGVVITPIYPQLIRMQPLFDMPQAVGPNGLTLSAHARSVFSITRLI